MICVDDVYRDFRERGSSPVTAWGHAIQARELREALDRGDCRVVTVRDEVRDGVYYFAARLEGDVSAYFEVTHSLDYVSLDFAKSEARAAMERRFAWQLCFERQ